MSIQEEDVALVLGRGLEDLKAKQAAHVSTFGLDRCRWDVDLDEGIIVFTNEKGWIISAPVQVVGTYNTLDQTWLWGWDHPSVPAYCSEDAQLARKFGERHSLPQFTDRMITCTEDEAWRLTGVTCYLAKANGAYCGPAGTTHVFMTFGAAQIRQSV